MGTVMQLLDRASLRDLMVIRVINLPQTFKTAPKKLSRSGGLLLDL